MSETTDRRTPRDTRRPAIIIRPGTRRDLARLSHLHYRGTQPATVERVLCAHIEGDLAGVLAVSRPVLNAPWRALAWPGVFDVGTRKRRAQCINDLLRTISRVIVVPSCRGLGVASGLVRAYLADPITPATEALATMGAYTPFFERAGMVRFACAPALRDERLGRAMRRAGVVSAHRLLDARCARRLEPSLRAWARASRATARLADAPLAQIAFCAASTLIRPRLAFCQGQGPYAVARKEPDDRV